MGGIVTSLGTAAKTTLGAMNKKAAAGGIPSQHSFNQWGDHGLGFLLSHLVEQKKTTPLVAIKQPSSSVQVNKLKEPHVQMEFRDVVSSKLAES